MSICQNLQKSLNQSLKQKKGNMLHLTQESQEIKVKQKVVQKLMIQELTIKRCLRE